MRSKRGEKGRHLCREGGGGEDAYMASFQRELTALSPETDRPVLALRIDKLFLRARHRPLSRLQLRCARERYDELEKILAMGRKDVPMLNEGWPRVGKTF
jgi:hypothetical protein